MSVCIDILERQSNTLSATPPPNRISTWSTNWSSEVNAGEKKNKKTVFYCLCVVVIPVSSQAPDRLQVIFKKKANESNKVPSLQAVVIIEKSCVFSVYLLIPVPSEECRQLLPIIVLRKPHGYVVQEVPKSSTAPPHIQEIYCAIPEQVTC